MPGTELSSPLTPMFRWVIPGLLTVVAIVIIWQLTSTNPATPILLLGIFGIVVCVLVARWFDRAKRVSIDDDDLVVSDFSEELRIALGDIEQVYANRWLLPSRVSIVFQHPTIFGSVVHFFPKFATRLPGTPHPVHALLADARNQVQARSAE